GRRLWERFELAPVVAQSFDGVVEPPMKVEIARRVSSDARVDGAHALSERRDVEVDGTGRSHESSASDGLRSEQRVSRASDVPAKWLEYLFNYFIYLRHFPIA